MKPWLTNLLGRIGQLITSRTAEEDHIEIERWKERWISNQAGRTPVNCYVEWPCMQISHHEFMTLKPQCWIVWTNLHISYSRKQKKSWKLKKKYTICNNFVKYPVSSTWISNQNNTPNIIRILFLIKNKRQHVWSWMFNFIIRTRYFRRNEYSWWSYSVIRYMYRILIGWRYIAEK